MARYFTRIEILDRLQEQINQGKALLMFGAGIGLTAKCAERGGADLIGIYSTAIYKMAGLPSVLAWLPYSNCNEHLLKMSADILPVVKDTPCIAGVGAHDPTLDIDKFLDQLISLGFSGITNEPFCSLYGEYFAQQMEQAGIGFSKEVELIRKAHAKDIFTIAWAMSPQEAEEMALAGADVIGAMIGVTTGGISGATETTPLEQATLDVQAMIEAARKVNPDVIVLTHGGPFNDVETAKYSIQNSAAEGYASGSSGERIPTEQAVIEITKQYKEIKIF